MRAAVTRAPPGRGGPATLVSKEIGTELQSCVGAEVATEHMTFHC